MSVAKINKYETTGIQLIEFIYIFKPAAVFKTKF